MPVPVPSWFQKLRRRRKKKKQSPGNGQGGSPAGTARASVSSANNCPSRQCQAPPPEQPAACAASPNRASYYFPSADRARRDVAGRLRRVDADAAAAALDVRVDVVHRRAGERRRRLGGLDAPPGTPELKLRRIVARHDASDDGASSAATSAATTPSTRARGFHVKSAGGRSRRRRRRPDHDGGARKDQKAEAAADAAEAAASPSRQGGARRRRWLYESLVVVKASSDPERELAESMAEMVAANGIRSSQDLEELLACYLALNAAEHHRAVVAAFRRVWFHLAKHRLHVLQPASDPRP